MKTKILFFSLVFIAAACNTQTKQASFVSIGGHKVNVEIAETESARQKGLGGRVSLGADEGMLFIFPNQDRHHFWMKDLAFPLDFIWINNGKVVDIAVNIPAEPEIPDDLLKIYSSQEPVNWVLEVNAGWAEWNGIKVGDSVELTR